jgi:hypothetical protein
MLTPHRSFFSADSVTRDDAADVVVILQGEGTSVPVTHDGFTIGSSRQCDLTLNGSSIPALHSLIHLQRGAIWIETADDQTALMVNDRRCRRMALRDGDRLTIGPREFSIALRTKVASMLEHPVVHEDLTLLSAEELCDRIVSEQSMVNEFADAQRAGWEALLDAIQAVSEVPLLHEKITELSAPMEVDLVDYDALLGQIQELNETIADRTRELNEVEAEVLASTSILEESQQRVSQRLDEIIEQLNESESPNELRASA